MKDIYPLPCLPCQQQSGFIFQGNKMDIVKSVHKTHPLKRPRAIQEKKQRWAVRTDTSGNLHGEKKQTQKRKMPSADTALQKCFHVTFGHFAVPHAQHFEWEQKPAVSAHEHKLNVLKIFFWTPSADVIHEEKQNRGGGGHCIFRELLKYIKWHPPFWLPGSKLKEHSANTNLISYCCNKGANGNEPWW